jgi:hypothetical protein
MSSRATDQIITCQFAPADYYLPWGFVFLGERTKDMIDTLVLPAGFKLAQHERENFKPPAQREPSTVTAERVGRQLAGVICERFPAAGIDQALLAMQIECDYLEWAYQHNVYILPLGFRSWTKRSQPLPHLAKRF